MDSRLGGNRNVQKSFFWFSSSWFTTGEGTICRRVGAKSAQVHSPHLQTDPASSNPPTQRDPSHGMSAIKAVVQLRHDRHTILRQPATQRKSHANGTANQLNAAASQTSSTSSRSEDLRPTVSINSAHKKHSKKHFRHHPSYLHQLFQGFRVLGFINASCY